MRKNWLGVLLLALLAASGSALAQTEVFCGDLSSADCDILRGSQMAMQNVTAASFDLFIDVQAVADGEEMAISVVGSGAYTGAFPVGDMSAAGVGSTEDVIAALREFNGQLMLTITVPPEITGDPDAPNMLTFDLRLVDGVGYINFDPLQPLINDPSFAGWGGLDFAGLLGALLEQDADFLGQLGQMSGMGDAGFSNFDPASVEPYLSLTRVDDGSGATATFETTVDLAGLMLDPAFSDSFEDMGDQAAMLENSSLVIRQDIDTATGSTRSISFELDLTDESEGMAQVTALVNFNYTAVPLVEAPADASILPYEQLLGMMGSMSGEMRPAAPPTSLAPQEPTATAAG